jgi:hypothetical protein
MSKSAFSALCKPSGQNRNHGIAIIEQTFSYDWYFGMPMTATPNIALTIIKSDYANMGSNLPLVAKEIAAIVSMLLRLDGLTNVTIDYVSLR